MRSALRRSNLSAPVPEVEPTEEHAAQVGEVRDITVRIEGGEDFDQRIADHEIFGLHRDGREEQHDALVGERHAKRQQHAVASTAGSDRHPGIEKSAHRQTRHPVGDHRIVIQAFQIILSQLPQFLTKCSADATQEIIDDEATLPHGLLNDAPEHPQREHVEQHMRPRTVQKHVGHHLPEVEIGGQEEVQAEKIGEHIAPTLRHQLLHHEENDVDKQQIACDGWNGTEKSVGRHGKNAYPRKPHRPLPCATRG